VPVVRRSQATGATPTRRSASPGPARRSPRPSPSTSTEVINRGQPVVDFGTLHWSNATVNGSPLAAVSPAPVVVVNATGMTGPR